MKPSIAWFKPAYSSRFLTHMDLYSYKKCRVPLVCHSCDLILTAELLQEAAAMVDKTPSSALKKNQAPGNLRFKRQAPIGIARRPHMQEAQGGCHISPPCRGARCAAGWLLDVCVLTRTTLQLPWCSFHPNRACLSYHQYVCSFALNSPTPTAGLAFVEGLTCAELFGKVKGVNKLSSTTERVKATNAGACGGGFF